MHLPRNIMIMAGLILVLLPATTLLVCAQDAAKRQAEFNLKNGTLAVEGYDVVSYFQGKPQRGNKDLSYTYKGVTYWFATPENRELFKENPQHFEPQYGGWCAYAMGLDGSKVKIDPKTYKIVDGKLYLFYNFYFNNTLIDWNNNEQALKQAADANWQKIMDKK